MFTTGALEKERCLTTLQNKESSVTKTEGT